MTLVPGRAHCAGSSSARRRNPVAHRRYRRHNPRAGSLRFRAAFHGAQPAGGAARPPISRSAARPVSVATYSGPSCGCHHGRSSRVSRRDADGPDAAARGATASCPTGWHRPAAPPSPTSCHRRARRRRRCGWARCAQSASPQPHRVGAVLAQHLKGRTAYAVRREFTRACVCAPTRAGTPGRRPTPPSPAGAPHCRSPSNTSTDKPAHPEHRAPPGNKQDGLTPGLKSEACAQEFRQPPMADMGRSGRRNAALLMA